MSIERYWFLLVAVAAVAHALWNFFVKQSEDKHIFIWSLRIWAVLWVLPISIWLWPTEGIAFQHVLFWGLGSILLHGLYAKVLARSYEYSDFTLAYPVARGLGPVIVVCIGIAILGEPASLWILAGTGLVFAGFYILYAGWDMKTGVNILQILKKNPFPLLVGISIAGYTVFDKLAITYIPPIILNVIENAGQVVMLSTDIRKKKYSDISAMWKKSWIKMSAAGLFSALSYILILVVLTKIPVSKVAPVRESGIIIGTILGLFVLKEEFLAHKVVGSILIFAGAVAIVLR